MRKRRLRVSVPSDSRQRNPPDRYDELKLNPDPPRVLEFGFVFIFLTSPVLFSPSGIRQVGIRFDDLFLDFVRVTPVSRL